MMIRGRLTMLVFRLLLQAQTLLITSTFTITTALPLALLTPMAKLTNGKATFGFTTAPRPGRALSAAQPRVSDIRIGSGGRPTQPAAPSQAASPDYFDPYPSGAAAKVNAMKCPSIASCPKSF